MKDWRDDMGLQGAFNNSFFNIQDKLKSIGAIPALDGVIAAQEKILSATAPFYKHQKMMDNFMKGANPFYNHQKALSDLMRGADALHSFANPIKIPNTAIDVITGSNSWWTQNKTFASLAIPDLAINTAITGLSSTLLHYSKEFIEEIEEEETKEKAIEEVRKIENSIDSNVLAEKDVEYLKNLIETKFSESEKSSKTREYRGYAIGILIGLLFYLLSQQQEKTTNKLTNNKKQPENIELVVDTNKKSTAYFVLDTFGLRKTTATILKLRTEPNTKPNSSIIAKLPLGTYVHIIENGKGWVKVKCDDEENEGEYLEGWVSKRYITSLSEYFEALINLMEDEEK